MGILFEKILRKYENDFIAGDLEMPFKGNYDHRKFDGGRLEAHKHSSMLQFPDLFQKNDAYTVEDVVNDVSYQQEESAPILGSEGNTGKLR